MKNLKENSKFHISKWAGWTRVEHYFKFDTFKATWKKELIGGLTMFLAVLYILSVEPNMMGKAVSINASKGAANMNEFGVFLAMCIATFLSTFVMGLFANIPAIVAPSMGVNAMFVFNIADAKGGVGYEGALIATALSSILFLIFSITPLRRIVIAAIPKSLQIGIGVGIGFFVAYVGIADIGWTSMSKGDLPIASIGDLKSNYPQVILGSGLFLLMLLFHFKKINGGVAISMLIGLVIALIVANAGPNLAISKDGGAFNAANFVEHGWKASSYDFGGFKSNIVNTWKEFVTPEIWEKPVMYISIFMFIFLNFFDATGTLMTFNNELNKKTGQDRPLPNSAMIIDSGATVVGSAMGVSPLGAFVESGSGIAVGARTGVASMFASVWFLVAIAIFPIFQAVPTCVSGAACVFVGVSMMGSIADIDWKKPEFAVSVFLGIVFMVVQYTITNGIAIMFIVYTFIMMVKKHFKNIPIPMYVLSVLFIGYFVAYAFML